MEPSPRVESLRGLPVGRLARAINSKELLRICCTHRPPSIINNYLKVIPSLLRWVPTSRPWSPAPRSRCRCCNPRSSRCIVQPRLCRLSQACRRPPPTVTAWTSWLSAPQNRACSSQSSSRTVSSPSLPAPAAAPCERHVPRQRPSKLTKKVAQAPLKD